MLSGSTGALKLARSSDMSFSREPSIALDPALEWSVLAPAL